MFGWIIAFFSGIAKLFLRVYAEFPAAALSRGGSGLFSPHEKRRAACARYANRA